jgi:hypothetical protein
MQSPHSLAMDQTQLFLQLNVEISKKRHQYLLKPQKEPLHHLKPFVSFFPFHQQF